MSVVRSAVTDVSFKELATLHEYAELEQQVDQGEESAIWARWRVGRMLLAERRANGNGKQLPNGRLAQVAEAVGRVEGELRFRIQFAEQYPTEEEVATAVATCKSWTESRRTLRKDTSGKGGKNGSNRNDKDEEKDGDDFEEDVVQDPSLIPEWIEEIEVTLVGFDKLGPIPPTAPVEAAARARDIARSLRSLAKRIDRRLADYYECQTVGGQLPLEEAA